MDTEKSAFHTWLVHLGVAVRTKRMQLGLTTRQLGKEAGTSYMSIIRQEESRHQTMNPSTFAKMAERLGESEDSLMLRAVLGPSPTFTDQLRFQVGSQLLDMDDDELNQMWAAASDVRARRPAAPAPIPQHPTIKPARRRIS